MTSLTILNIGQPSAIVGRNSGRYSAYLGGGPPEDWNGWDASRRISQASVVNLFQVSKDILNESLELYFHYNSFYFDYSNLVETFLRKIGARSRHAITSIQMRLDGDKPATAAKSLSLCPNLERLDLTISGSVRILDGRCRFPYDAMKICGLNHLLKLRGIKDLTIKFLCPSHTTDQLFRNWDSLVRALQVIKKPRSKAQADRRLRKKALDLSQTPRKASKHRRGRVGKRELELLV